MVQSTLYRLRVAARSVARAPGFAATAILTLALGIGLSTAVFTVADAVLLRRLPVADENRIISLWGTKAGDPTRYPLSVAKAREFVRGTRTLSRASLVTYEGVWPTPIREGDRVSRVNRALVTGDFFDMLGAHALIGRGLAPSDDRSGASPVAVLSYRAWQQRFGARADIIGQRIVPFDTGAALTVVGVMPAGLDFPKGTDIWTAMFASVPESGEQFMALHIVGRLASRATAANARDELTAFYHRPEMGAMERTFRAASETLPQAIVGDTRPAVFAVGLASALLLIITCLNVANLLLVRGIARTREMAVRAALGGARAVLIGQLLVENALLAAASGALGFVVASGVVRAFVVFAPATLPRLEEIRVDTSVLFGALTITTAAMLLFAVVPALMTSRVDAQEALRAGARQQGSRRARVWTEAMVATQIALAMLVLSAAGIVARSLIALEGVDLPFDPSRMIVADLSMRSDQYADVATQRAVVERVAERLSKLPGVTSAAPVVSTPYGAGWDGNFTAEGQSAADAAGIPSTDIGVVTPEFFSTFGLRPLAGRLLTLDDRQGSTPVVVISESVARRYWPGASAIGKRFVRTEEPRYTTVVGVVPDMRYRDLREARPSVYFPLRQSHFPFVPTVLAMRTRGDPASMIATIRAAVAGTEPGVAVASIAPFEAFLAKPLAQPRMNALLLSVFACAAVLLSAVGLLGVMLTMARQRTRELGVRLALGAQPAQLSRMLLSRGIGIAAVGIGVGLTAALMLDRSLASMVYGVSATDAVTLATSVVCLVATAGVASLIPARGVARLDPVVALRSDA